MTTTRHESIREVHEDLGGAGELAVAALIRRRGHQVRVDAGKSPHDLVVNGSTTVEVKTALPSAPANGVSERWQFKLFEDDGAHRPMEEDVLVLRCQEDRNGGEAFHYVIPGSVVPRGLKRIDITSHPERYGGKYSLFLGAWFLLDAVVALRDRNGVQIGLPEPGSIPF